MVLSSPKLNVNKAVEICTIIIGEIPWLLALVAVSLTLDKVSLLHLAQNSNLYGWYSTYQDKTYTLNMLLCCSQEPRARECFIPKFVVIIDLIKR